jgi:hypothetical protein
VAVLFFHLRGVPEDEAQQVKALLNQNNILFYETFPGNWGISTPALWLKDESQLSKAGTLLDEYQQQRQAESKAEFQKLLAEGKNKTILDSFKQHPFRFILYFTLIFFVLYVSVRLVIDLGTLEPSKP